MAKRNVEKKEFAKGNVNLITGFPAEARSLVGTQRVKTDVTISDTKSRIRFHNS